MRVLLIDDDKDDGQLFMEVIEEIDPSIEVTHEEDPQEALRKFDSSSARLPQIIFLDINMPVISGWQCLAEFKKREHLKAIPVFMYTTSSRQREKDIAEDLGAAGFITKPDDYNLLKRTLAGILC